MLYCVVSPFTNIHISGILYAFYVFYVLKMIMFNFIVIFIFTGFGYDGAMSSVMPW